MISKELLEIIDKISLKLEEKFPWMSRKEKILSHWVKLSEEVWELSWEILKKIWKQRKEKLDNFSEENLKEEFVDVILTALILAKSLEIDINEALKIKLEKIEKRGGI